MDTELQQRHNELMRENAALKKRGGELQAEYRSLQGSIAEIVRIKDKAEADLAQERKDKNAWLVAYQKKVTNLETDLAVLKEVYSDYVKLLVCEINGLVPLAITHGWKSTRYEEGVMLRAKIKAALDSMK